MHRTVMVLALGLLLAAVGGAEEAAKAPKVKLAKDEQALFDLVNKARAKEKLPALKLSAVLCEVARKHSENMAKQGKMAHKLDDQGVGDRVTAAGYVWRSVRENLARAEGDADLPAPDPAEIHKGWMESKGHKENILAAGVTEVGLSVIRDRKGAYYYTQVFARPRE